SQHRVSNFLCQSTQHRPAGGLTVNATEPFSSGNAVHFESAQSALDGQYEVGSNRPESIASRFNPGGNLFDFCGEALVATEPAVPHRIKNHKHPIALDRRAQVFADRVNQPVRDGPA
ncbi:hypothetical protein, partial [Polaromonas sp. UBA4122]|uniref:hypothetical protein n=1 Tax=Polaromonas sp. UBA4122 TaxID=1947074 RepID=UPI0025F8D345